jgi:hypothetical protein
MNMYWRSLGIDPRFLYLSTRWRFTFTLNPLYSQEKNPLYPAYRRFGGPGTSLDAVAKRKENVIIAPSRILTSIVQSLY